MTVWYVTGWGIACAAISCHGVAVDGRWCLQSAATWDAKSAPSTELGGWWEVWKRMELEESGCLLSFKVQLELAQNHVQWQTFVPVALNLTNGQESLMDGFLVSNKIHFIGIWNCNNLGQVAIIVPILILFLNPIHHGLSFLIYFKPNLLLFLTVSLCSCYLHFSSCMFQYCSFNMEFLSPLNFCVSMPLHAIQC